MIFQPLRDPRARLILKETSWARGMVFICCTSGSGVAHLELTADPFLEDDFSLRALKLLALMSSLLKLLARFRAGLMGRGDKRGEPGGTGEPKDRGEGDLDCGRLLTGEGDCLGDVAGVDRGDSSSMFQNSNLMSGLSGVLGVPLDSTALLGVDLFDLGGVMPLRGGVKLSRFFKEMGTNCGF